MQHHIQANNFVCLQADCRYSLPNLFKTSILSIHPSQVFSQTCELILVPSQDPLTFPQPYANIGYLSF